MIRCDVLIDPGLLVRPDAALGRSRCASPLTHRGGTEVAVSIDVEARRPSGFDTNAVRSSRIASLWICPLWATAQPLTITSR